MSCMSSSCSNTVARYHGDTPRRRVDPAQIRRRSRGWAGGRDFGVWPASGFSGNQRHADQFGQAGCPHLGHYIGPVNLDGAGAKTQIIRDGLVWVTGQKTVENLFLARGEGGKPSLDLGDL